MKLHESRIKLKIRQKERKMQETSSQCRKPSKYSNQHTIDDVWKPSNRRLNQRQHRKKRHFPLSSSVLSNSLFSSENQNHKRTAKFERPLTGIGKALKSVTSLHHWSPNTMRRFSGASSLLMPLDLYQQLPPSLFSWPQSRPQTKIPVHFSRAQSNAQECE